MAGRRRTSKKLSAASGLPEGPAFFLDAGLGRYTIADGLPADGFRVELHDDHFRQGAPDEEWLPAVGERWILLTKDDRLRTSSAQRQILLSAGVRAFVLSSANMTGAEMAQAYRRAAMRMLRMASSEKRPFVARVGRSGEVTILVRAPRHSRGR